RALALHPGYLPALQARGRLLLALGRWGELVAMHERSLTVAESNEERADLHGRIALLLWRRLGEHERAVAHFLRVLACRPGDLGALKALETIALEQGHRQELADVLLLQAEAAGSPAARALLLARRGAVLERLAAGEEEALAAYAQAIVAQPTFLPAYRSLVRLHGAAGRWAEVARVIGAMLEVEEDPAQRVLLLMRLATIQREQLHDQGAAKEAYQRVLALDPGHPSVLRAMEAALRREGDPRRLVPVLEARARSLDDPLLAGAYLLEIDRLGPLATRAGKSPEALLVSAMKQEPWGLSGLERLEGLASRRREAESLADFYSRALESIEEETTRRDLELRQAELLEEAGRLEEALALYRELYERDPADLPVLKGLQRALQALGDGLGLLRAVEQEGRVAAAVEQVVPELLAAGDEWLRRGERARAGELFELALRRHPDGFEALLRLEELLEQQSEQERLGKLLEALLPGVGSPRARLEIHLRLALRAEREHDLISARGHLAAALTAMPDDLRAHHAHARILQELGADEDATREWQVVADHAQTS
ncbi:MAG: tetratricopeptide repeat protein, partial [Deltaproteobacteria bacterium]|nr:tetratricopeptide repeat protein [Deltaproteobacteria bacterium]